MRRGLPKNNWGPRVGSPIAGKQWHHLDRGGFGFSLRRALRQHRDSRRASTDRPTRDVDLRPNAGFLAAGLAGRRIGDSGFLMRRPRVRVRPTGYADVKQPIQSTGISGCSTPLPRTSPRGSLCRNTAVSIWMSKTESTRRRWF